MYRSLWVSGSRADPFFPLCPRRSSWIRRPRTSHGLPAPRVAAHAPSDIIRTRSRHYISFWRAFCCGNYLTAPTADLLLAERRHRNRSHPCRFCRGERGSVCHASVRHSTSLSLSTTRQRQPPTPFDTIGKPLRLLPPN